MHENCVKIALAELFRSEISWKIWDAASQMPNDRPFDKLLPQTIWGFLNQDFTDNFVIIQLG